MRSRPGFTLAESMIAVVIVGMVAAALAGVLAAAYQQQAFAREQSAMLQAARALLEEIAALPFTEPDGSNGGGFLDGNMDRATYNDLFDFDGYSDLSPFRGLGSATSGQGGGGGDSSIGPGYRRRVRVEGRTSPQVSAGALEAPKFARVEVQVTSPRGRSISLERWMAHYVLN